tara:strand:+ start:173 stop:919 length:747 start_codon:yes stop_codon:yes gene_type:complete
VRLGERAILFHCFAGCDTRDVLTALRRRKLHDAVPLTMPRPKAMADHRALALRLWKASQPIVGSPAADYLAARGLAPPYPRCLRYNPRTIVGAGDQRRFFPAMIAAVENDLGVVAVQRTCLDLADILHKPLSKPKIALGLLGNAAIRLAPAGEELGLAEGIEDALSAMAWFGTPTWALGGVERLGLVAIPERVKRIIVYGDRGAAAAAMLKKARPHLTANGRELVLRLPERHADWNDAWRVRRAAEAA